MTKFQFPNNIQIQNSKFSKLFYSWFLVLGAYLVLGAWILVIPVKGQSPTPEPSPAAEEETTDEKVKGIREAVKEKVQEKLEKIKEGQKMAFVGGITEITETSLFLETNQGGKQVNIDDETKFIGSERKEITFDDLEVGNFIIAMGYLQDEDTLDAVRLVIIKKPKVPSRLVAFGIVEDKSAEEKILTVKHPKKGIVYEVDADDAKKITKKIEGKVQNVKFDDIEVGDRLVAIGSPTDKENSLTAKIIHVIPGKISEEVEASPTPEAESQEE